MSEKVMDCCSNLPETQKNPLVRLIQSITTNSPHLALFSIFGGFGYHCLSQKSKNISCGSENGLHQWSKYDQEGYFRCNVAQNFGCKGFYNIFSHGDAKYCQNTGCGMACCRKCG